MRVALDARTMQSAPRGGIGRGLAALLPYLTQHVDLELLTAAAAPAIDLGSRSATTAPPVQHPLPTPWPGHATGWLQWSAPRFLRDFDGVFHCPFYALPLRQSVPMAVTIHDLTFEHHPEWFRRGQATAFRQQARWAAKSAKVVIAPSETVATDIVTTYGTSRDRIVIAPNSITDDFRRRRDPSPRLKALDITEPYLLALGGPPRRGLPVALEAWQRARASAPIDLVVVGADSGQVAPARGMGTVTDDDWIQLLAGATAFVYPTHYEGFGMPALEAMAIGTPVICASVGALPEVLGDAAFWCDRPDVASIADGIRRAVTDTDAARSIRLQGFDRAAQHPTWSAVADLYVDAYRRAARA